MLVKLAVAPSSAQVIMPDQAVQNLRIFSLELTLSRFKAHFSLPLISPEQLL